MSDTPLYLARLDGHFLQLVGIAALSPQEIITAGIHVQNEEGWSRWVQWVSLTLLIALLLYLRRPNCKTGIVMMHCECGWAWEWDDDPTPYCPFCGKIGAAGPGVPQEAEEKIRQAKSE